MTNVRISNSRGPVYAHLPPSADELASQDDVIRWALEYVRLPRPVRPEFFRGARRRVAEAIEISADKQSLWDRLKSDGPAAELVTILGMVSVPGKRPLSLAVARLRRAEARRPLRTALDLADQLDSSTTSLWHDRLRSACTALLELPAKEARGIPEGRRRRTLARRARAMAASGESMPTITKVLTAENDACRPPLPQKELAKLLAYAERYARPEEAA